MDRLQDNTPPPFTLATDATDGVRVVRHEPADGETIGIGSLLRGRYRLRSVIGRGGMADVYRAIDQVLAREVAVKVFRPGTDRHADRKRFLGEVHTLAGLTHPHLIALYDGGQHEAQPWCVMQFIDGGTMADLHGEQAPATIAAIGTQIADALAYIHELGIVHRDVKPSNVLLDGYGGAYLSDFGVAQIVDATRMTATGALLGTAAYLSPEQVRGRPATPAVDVYALGLVLLEIITGHREFPGAPVESAVARLSRPPHIPESLGPAWTDLLTAMTDVDPTHRPDSAFVAGALRALARGEDHDDGIVTSQRATAGATGVAGAAGAPSPAAVGPHAPLAAAGMFIGGEPATTGIRTAGRTSAVEPSAPPSLGPRIVRLLSVNPAGTAAVSLAVGLGVLGISQLPAFDRGGPVVPLTTVDATVSEAGSSGGGLGSDELSGRTGAIDGSIADWRAETYAPAPAPVRPTSAVVAGTTTTVQTPLRTAAASPSPSQSTGSGSPSPSVSPSPSPSLSPSPSTTTTVQPSPSPSPSPKPSTSSTNPTPSVSSGTGGGGLTGSSTSPAASPVPTSSPASTPPVSP